MEAFDLGKEIDSKTLKFRITIPTYAQKGEKVENYDINSLQWREVKFLNDDGNLHDEMNTIPNNKGGIYTFRIKSDILPELANYLVYVGRAQYHGTSYSLRGRCRRYLKDTRLSIERMRRTWGKHLYISYVILEDNELIVDLENYLIESLLPIFNSDIKDPIIKEAKRMFDY